MTKKILEKKLPKGAFVVFNDRPDFDFFEVTQVHGAEVLPPTNENREADGLFILNTSDLKAPLAIKTADCLPITLLGPDGVAHLHAGWRGLHQKIFLHEHVKELKPTYAFIGPAIHQESYEVGTEFLDHFPELPECFTEGTNPGKYLFNLPKAASTFLSKSYPGITIEVSDLNTFTTPGHNSYRLNKTTTRNYNLYYPEHLYKK